ncbi:PH domain-containing protein [Blastococcus sp. SYSU DS0533]
MIATVTPSDAVLELRPPRFSTALYGASVVVAVVLVVFVLATGGPPLFRAVFAAFAVGITGYNTATVLSRVRAHADGGLEVRNRLQTRRLERAEIDRVAVGRQGGFGSARGVELVLTNGTTLPLVATETLPFPGQGQLEEQAAELRRWLAGAPPASR